MKFDYKKIKSQDALELAKYMVLDDIHKSTKRMKLYSQNAIMPQDKSLMHSEVGLVRFAAYCITAYKTLKTTRKALTFFKKKK